jgi:hypothetical protein
MKLMKMSAIGGIVPHLPFALLYIYQYQNVDLLRQIAALAVLEINYLDTIGVLGLEVFSLVIPQNAALRAGGNMARKNAVTIPLTPGQRRRLSRVARALGWGNNVAGYVHQWVGVGVVGVERSRIFKKRAA